MKATAKVNDKYDYMIHVSVTGEGSYVQRSISAKAVAKARQTAKACGLGSVAMISSGVSFHGDAWEFRATFHAK